LGDFAEADPDTLSIISIFLEWGAGFLKSAFILLRTHPLRRLLRV